MKTIDRLILGASVIGVWALVAIQVTPVYADPDPDYTTRVYASNVDGLKGFIVKTVEDCTGGVRISC